MKAVGYIRVSTDRQVKDGDSLDAQESRIRAWALTNGYDQVELFTDAGISGSSMDKREGLQAALDTVGKGDALVVYSLSRLARSTKDTLAMAERLMDAGADLVSLSERIDTTTAAGKMVFRMLAVLNEFERDQISERTRTVMSHKKSKGERVGSIPYGHVLGKDRKTLVPDLEEQGVVRLVLEYHAAGMGLRPTARALKERGVLTRQGKEFAPIQIQRIIEKHSFLDANSPVGDTQARELRSSKVVCG